MTCSIKVRCGFDKDWGIDSNGDRVFTYGYQFGERSVQDGTNVYVWNHFYRNESGDWAKLLQTDGSPIYHTTPDFAWPFLRRPG